MAGEQKGASTSSSSNDPHRDAAIFRPDGTILFPRSDGDASYAAPNTDPPPTSTQDINYFHIMSPGETKYDRWVTLIGSELAAWAGQPAKPPEGKEWKLAGFPENYQMTEQRKGPRDSYRTDQYLYGSAGHRFRSMKEFIPHAQWLILDDGSRCTCKYCPTGRPRQSNGASSLRDKKEQPARAVKPPNPQKKMAPSNSFKVKTQELPSPQERASLGVTVPSIPLRDSELARTSAAKEGDCEGFRIGEIVWVVLKQPLVDPEDSKRIIDKWPAQIEDVTTTTHVAHVDPQPPEPTARSLDPRNAHTDDKDMRSGPANDVFSLNGRVSKERQYDVVFVGAPEDKARLPENHLLPFLAGFISELVRESSFGNIEDHAWFHGASGFPPQLHLLDSLVPDDRRPAYGKLVGALAFSMTTCNYLRSRYRVTDPFTLPEGVHADPEGESQILDPPHHNANSDAPVPDAGISVNKGSPSGSPSRPSRLFRSAKDSTYKSGTYYQGVFAGLERIWVGDVVRLKLRGREIKDMMEVLDAHGQLARKSDAKDGADLKGTYIMRVRAFTADGKNVKVAGSVYQVMTQAEFDTKKAAEQALYVAASHQQQIDIAGLTQQFAFPALNFLQANGQELPASPLIPTGFVLSRVNVESHEVVLDMTKVAGRLYGSLSKAGDPEQIYSMKEVQKMVFDKYPDTKDANLARLSLVGALPGVVKSMQVESWERGSATELMKQCFDIARGDIYEVIKKDLERPPPAASTALSQDATDTITAVAAAAAAAASASPSGDSSKQNNVNKANNKRKSTSGGVAAAADASAVSQSKRPATDGNAASGKTPLRSAAGRSPTMTTPTITSSAPTTTRVIPFQSIAEDPSLPPLRPGWIVQQSRHGHGHYYAHPATKATTWTRPT